MIKVTEATAPAIWASYLVNGDSSGLDESDVLLADEWCKKIAPYHVVGTVDDSERFTWSGKLYGADCDGVTVCDYIIHAIESPYIVSETRKAAGIGGQSGATLHMSDGSIWFHPDNGRSPIQLN